MSLTRLASQTLIRVNSQRVNGVLHTRHSVIFRKNKLNLLFEKIIFRKYSTKTSRVSATLGVSDVNNQVENTNEKYYYDYNYVKYMECNNQQHEEMQKKRERIFEEIADGDAEILKKLKLLEMEIAVLREQGMNVVNNPTKSQWEELLKNFDTSLHSKKRLLNFMALNEKLEFYDSKKKDIKAKNMLERKDQAGFHHYGLSGHSIVPRLTDNFSLLNKFIALRHMMANQKIVLDCSYDEFMNERCKKDLAKQIVICLLEMKSHQYPCQLVFCGLEQNSDFGRIIKKYVPHIFNEDFYCDVSAQLPIDLYPKEKLVYLSPHAQNDLMEINEDDIYVIGGFVDKGVSLKASLAKAKKEQVRAARFPIDLYLFWKQGSKCLPINIVVKILMDMMFYNDWNIALKCIANKSKNDTFRRKNQAISDSIGTFEDVLNYISNK